jgi:uncharacterized protein YjbJ (UPF0337 family)
MGLEDKIENQRDEVKGAAKEQVGQATDDQQLESEGKTDQAISNLKQAGEKVKDAVREDGPKPDPRQVSYLPRR